MGALVVVGRAALQVGTDAQGVTISSGATVTRVEAWSDRIARVTHRHGAGIASTDSPDTEVNFAGKTIVLHPRR